MKAEILTRRFEVKYLVRRSRREEILAAISEHTRADEHAHSIGPDRLGYTVHTLYFDTEELADYCARLNDAPVRVRVRIRSYGRPEDRSAVFLETKHKLDSAIVKNRFAWGDAQAWCADRSPEPWKARTTAGLPGQTMQEKFCRHAANRKPVTVVRYEREAFKGLSNPRERITLDHSVRVTRCSAPGELFSATEEDVIPPEWLVLELKFDRSPSSWMMELTRTLRLCPVAVSKFALGISVALRSDHPRELRRLMSYPWANRRELARAI